MYKKVELQVRSAYFGKGYLFHSMVYAVPSSKTLVSNSLKCFSKQSFSGSVLQRSKDSLTYVL